MFDTATETADGVAMGLATDLEELVAAIHSDQLDDALAVDLLGQLDRIERLASAGKALVAASIEAGDAWRGQGSRDAIGFVADRTATSRARIREALAVTDCLGSSPVLDHAFRRGVLTVSQAADIAAAVNEHPEVESELVALASQVAPRQLKARCVEICAQGKGADDQHQRAKAERSVSSNVGRDGIWRLSARLPVIDGALIDKALDFFQTEIFDQARQHGDREPFAAYRADALVALALTATDDTQTDETDETQTDETDGSNDSDAAGPDSASPAGSVGANGGPGSGSCTKPPAKRPKRKRPKRSSSIRHAIVVTVPHTVFQADGLQPGQTCMVPGVGPVPVSVVHELLEDDPIIKAVVTNGRDITAVATLTRTVKEDLRLAVLATNELTCAVPHCTNTRFLQLDHELEYHRGGPTSYDNLRPLCTTHHNQRTRQNYELQGKPGHYQWLDPDGRILSTEPALSTP